MALDNSLYNGAQASSLMSTAASFNMQFANQFVALHGQEYSTNSGGNHINVFDISEVIDEEVVPNKRFDLFYPWITARLDTTGRVPIVQLNHPKSINQDYGVLNFKTLEATLAAARPFVRNIQIINGPHSAQGPGIGSTRLSPVRICSTWMRGSVSHQPPIRTTTSLLTVARPTTGPRSWLRREPRATS